MTELFEKYGAFAAFPVLACALSLVITKISIIILPRLGMLDHPRGRHIHENATPKGGGIAIIISFFAAWICFSLSRWNNWYGSLDNNDLWKIAIPAAGLLLIGLIDDRFDLRARYKLLGQTLIAALCWILGFKFGRIFGVELNPAVSFSLTIVWIVGFINAFNLADGLDGLAAGLTVVSSSCMAAVFTFQHFPYSTVVILCLAGAALGFLRYNYHPAKIFMGDTGSMFLGFTFAIIGIVANANKATLTSVMVPILASGVPVFDVILAIWRRLSRKIMKNATGESGSNSVMDADSEHLHHRLFARHQHQGKAVWALYWLAFLFASLALIMTMMDRKDQGLAFLVVLVVVSTLIRRLATIELWNSAQAITHTIKRPHKGFLISLIHPFLDIFLLTLAYTAVKTVVSFSTTWFIDLLMMTAPVTLALHVGGVYRRYWPRADINDLVRLAEWLFLGCFAAMMISYARHGDSSRLFIFDNLAFFAIATVLIEGERIALMYMKSILPRKLYLKTPSNAPAEKIALYGTGLECEFYTKLKNHDYQDDPVDIVGLFDDNPALWGQQVHGYQVLGGINQLVERHEKKPFHRLVVTEPDMDQHFKCDLRDACAKIGVEIKILEITEKQDG